MSTKYPQGIITPTPPFKSTTAQNFSGVWTLEQIANNYFYYKQGISNSLRFRSSASAYLSRTPATGGNRTTWTWSGWVKRGSLGSSQIVFQCDGGTTDQTFGLFGFTASDTFEFIAYTTIWRVTTQVFRDPSSWYHLVLAFDTTQAVAANRIKFYVNGVQVTAFSTSNDPTQNTSYAINQAAAHYIARSYGGRGYFDGYLAEVNFIDGQALGPSYFGQRSPITGVWSPAKYVGSYGTNGFYLKFTDTTSTTTLCYDYSGNGNNWTPNNISLTAGSTYDSMLDSPTSYDNGGNGVGNYCVLNPLYASPNIGLTGGNLNLTSTATYRSAIGSFGVSSGKWYWEHLITNLGPDQTLGISSNPNVTLATYAGGDAYSWAYEATTGNKYNNASFSAYGATFTTNDLIGVAFDADSGSITFYKNGVSQGVAFSGLAAGVYYPAIGAGNGSTGSSNFGQRPFAYTPPSGYKSLNTQNLSQPTIANGANYMAATLYTGNGGTQSIINAANSVSFQPDFVWVKERSTANNHGLYDVIRGVDNTLASNATNAESNIAPNGVHVFNSNGFSVGGASTVNENGNTFVAWQWKANGTAVTNTAGSITSQVSANTTAGFSVVTYTGNGSNGATVGHGLGIAPSLMFVKARVATSSVGNWLVYSKTLTATSYLLLNSTAASGSSVSIWYNTEPTSSVFTLGNDPDTNQSTKTYVAYCFAAIPGYSAFGSYTGNGSSDGPFVYCGFRPRYVLIKRATGTAGGSDWCVYDTARSTYNLADLFLKPNTSDSEQSGSTNNPMDILSNGFKLRWSTATSNASGETFIYAAFAENPFKYSLAR